MSVSGLYAVLLILLGVRLMQDWFLYGPRLSEAAYRRPVLVTQWLVNWRLVVPLAVVALPSIVAPGATAWEALGPFEPVRWVLTLMAGMLAWSLATCDRNLFLGRSHGIDRLLLVVLAGACAIHPGFIAVFVVHLLVFARQFEHPTCMLYSFTHTRLPLDLLTVGAVWPAAAAMVGPPPEVLVVVLLGAAASLYVIPGLAKARLGPFPGSWAVVNRTHRLFISAHLQGWLRSVPTQRILTIARAMSRLDRPLGCATLIVELASCFILLGRDAAMVLLVANVLLHLGILATTGINFWKWAVADAALAWFLWTIPDAAARALFQPAHLPIVLAMMATHTLHQRCPRLGWFDTSLNNAFRIEAVGRSGRVYAVSRSFLAPFDMIFAQSRHFFLDVGRVLVGNFGVTVVDGRRGWRMYQALEATHGDAAAIEQVRAKFGADHRDERMAMEFDRFFTELFGRINAGERSRSWWAVLAAPKHIYSRWPVDEFACQEPAVSVRVRYVETWCDGREVQVLNDRLVREIRIDGPASAMTGAHVPSAIAA